MPLSALAIRHVHFEDLGTLAPVLHERGYAVRHVDAHSEDLRSLDPLAPDLLVVLGGPIGAFDDASYPWLAHELDVVTQRLRAGLPILGICLGAQVMARALGAAVTPMGVKEIGFAPVSLNAAGRASVLAGLEDVPVLHWHGDRFEIPRGAQPLAGTALCANQAFAHGANALAVQFHLEADAARLEPWLVGHANELAQAGIDPRRLREDAARARPRLARAARIVFGDWLDQLPSLSTPLQD